jgi:hypothetical protein
MKTATPRHAYREPAPRLHLLAAITHPGAQPGRQVRLVLADDTVTLASVLPQPGPADLSLIWELPVLAVQDTPSGPVRVVHRSRREILTAYLRRVVASAMHLHDRAGAMLREFDARQDLLDRKSELLAWLWLPKLTKVAGQVRGHALADAYANGGTEAYLGLVGEVRALMWNDAVSGGAR